MQKFIILSSPRSGTHMLRSSLLNHPDIVVHHELFNIYQGFFHPYPLDTHALTILNDYAFLCPQNMRAVGLPIHEDEPSDKKAPHWLDAWQILKEMSDLKIIHLSRRNLLKRKISEEMAAILRQWTLYPHNQPRKGVVRIKSIIPQMLEKHFQTMNERYDHYHEFFSSQEKIQVVYEDLCNNYESVMRDIQSFLDVTQASLSTSTQKRPSYSLREIITNYDELKSYFSDTKWAEFFDE